jgi:hypothetical protein
MSQSSLRNFVPPAHPSLPAGVAGVFAEVVRSLDALGVLSRRYAATTRVGAEYVRGDRHAHA